jgi:eukaryotic-like serine/threonine-protein kinase
VLRKIARFHGDRDLGAQVHFVHGSTLMQSTSRRRTSGSASGGKRQRKATLVANQRVGAWRIDFELGRGGMGAVYAVTHNGFGKRAALKLCHKSILAGDVTATTFLREARIVNMIDHPAIPDVFAVGTYEGRPYLAMERFAGETLGRRLDREGLLPRGEAIHVLLELCDVLRAAHRAGVVHRDLKLDNVFLLDTPGPGNRRIKLFDWGVARVIEEQDAMSGMLAGTMTYVAPELIRGEEPTPASDIYSLGVLAYQLLLGQPPFASREDLELLRMHLQAEPPSPRGLWPEIPKDLSFLLLAMVAKDAGWRPTLDEIERVLLGAGHELRPVTRQWWSRLLRVVPGAPAVFNGARRHAVASTFGIASAAAVVMTLLGP